jgi:hypothetical protein
MVIERAGVEAHRSVSNAEGVEDRAQRGAWRTYTSGGIGIGLDHAQSRPRKGAASVARLQIVWGLGVTARGW